MRDRKSILAILKKLIGKSLSVFRGEILLHFQLPDSKFDVKLKKYDEEFYVLFNKMDDGTNYTFDIPQLKLRWMLLKIQIFYREGAEKFPDSEIYKADYEENVRFQFLKDNDRLLGRFISKVLFWESYTYLSSMDLCKLYSELSPYLIDKLEEQQAG